MTALTTDPFSMHLQGIHDGFDFCIAVAGTTTGTLQAI